MPQDANSHWMQKAFANSHGQFKAKAKAHGESTQQYANEVARSPNASTKTKRQAALARTARKVNS